MFDCKADVLNRLDTRFVVPLLPPLMAPTPARRLDPIFEIEGENYLMVTQFAAAIPTRDLGARIASLIDADVAITNALDLLMCGF